MGILVREADLATQMDTLRSLYDANRDTPAAPRRFPWLYLENPDGRATAWLAIDDRKGEAAGFTAVFPRRIRVAGHTVPVTAWNCGDFSIHKRFRTMGVAVKLRRAAKEAVDAGTCPFLYAHPNDRMLAVHVQAGHCQMGTMKRLVKPLSAGGGLAATLSRAALRVAGRDVLVRRRHDAEWLAPGATLPPDIGEIDAAVGPRLGNALVRDARYLQWRFADFPLEPVEVLVTRRQGRPAAYVAVMVKGATAFVKDWLARDADAFDQAWATLIGTMRRRKLARVSVTALETHPDLRRLALFGFVEREETSKAVVTYAAAGGGFEAVLDAGRWYMTVGDRDV
jgi:GNAT superfamily N-acetyltransferase